MFLLITLYDRLLHALRWYHTGVKCQFSEKKIFFFFFDFMCFWTDIPFCYPSAQISVTFIIQIFPHFIFFKPVTPKTATKWYHLYMFPTNIKLEALFILVISVHVQVCGL